MYDHFISYTYFWKHNPVLMIKLHVPDLWLVWTKHSGSIPRNACVACETKLCVTTKKVWLPDRHTHRQTDGQTDAGQSDPYVPLCFTGDTKIVSSCDTQFFPTLHFKIYNSSKWTIKDKPLPSVQLLPIHPLGHWHRYDPRLLIHVAPLWHIMKFWHSSTSVYSNNKYLQHKQYV